MNLAACARAQREYLAAIDNRKFDVTRAVEQGATYREIADAIGSFALLGSRNRQRKGEVMYAIVGHYCPTDANPETDLDGELGVWDDRIRVVIFNSKEEAERELPWYPDGVILQAGRSGDASHDPDLLNQLSRATGRLATIAEAAADVMDAEGWAQGTVGRYRKTLREATIAALTDLESPLVTAFGTPGDRSSASDSGIDGSGDAALM